MIKNELIRSTIKELAKDDPVMQEFVLKLIEIEITQGQYSNAYEKLIEETLKKKENNREI